MIPSRASLDRVPLYFAKERLPSWAGARGRLLAALAGRAALLPLPELRTLEAVADALSQKDGSRLRRVIALRLLVWNGLGLTTCVAVSMLPCA